MKTDTELQQDVIAELRWEPSINANRIGVAVEDGVVTLAGHVDSYADKWNAERAAQRVHGVNAMVVEIDVELPMSSKRSDSDIARAAESALEWRTALPGDRVRVMVENGWVTLTGNLDWDFQRRSASSAVRNLLGVVGVSDNIVITPAISRSAVKSDIEAALKRRAITDASRISVEVRGADVILSGTAHSWSERELATHSAWGTPGVRNVVNDMTLSP